MDAPYFFHLFSIKINYYIFTLQVTVIVNGVQVLNTELIDVFRMWEETSYQLECLQANSDCIKEEWRGSSFLLSTHFGIYTIFISNSVFVFKISPRQSTAGYKPVPKHIEIDPLLFFFN